jgi:hypothetical protein
VVNFFSLYAIRGIKLSFHVPLVIFDAIQERFAALLFVV